MIYWRLIQPVERSGLGIAPSEAKRLTIDEAEFLLWDEKQVKRSDAEIRKRLIARGAKPDPAKKKRVSAGEYLAKLRRYFTGKESPDG